MPRNTIVEELEEISKMKDVIVLSPDCSKLTYTEKFASKKIKQFVQCGGAIDNMLGIAAGLALEGKTPVAIMPAKLHKSEALQTICSKNLNVTIIGTHAGLSEYGNHAISDFTHCSPDLKIIEPADKTEAGKAIRASILTKGPVYIRLNENSKQVTDKKTSFVFGRTEIMQAGRDCTIAACGSMVHEALKASQLLAQEEIQCTVLNTHTINPVDKNALLSSAKLTGCVLSVEEHFTHNGLGSKILQALSETNIPVKILGVRKNFGAGNRDSLLKMHKIDAESISKAVQELVLEKHRSFFPEISQEHGRYLEEVQAEKAFELHRGGSLRSIIGLQKALLEMSDETFSHHCNKHKNDFSKWVKEVLKEEILAKEISRVKSKKGMINVISRWLK